MQRVTMESRGVRLHPTLWKRIEGEAKALRLKPTDFLRRRIETAFDFDPDAHTMPAYEHNTPDLDNAPFTAPEEQN